ncbi:MAG: VWA domain-containing protein [Bryobacteraceae bacterium]|nr:VWA domain-containing protein [Bryobacteraceae bacterium]
MTLCQGALRFAVKKGGSFLAPHATRKIPPLMELPRLLSAAERVLEDTDSEDDVRLLLAPGSSLGGARPKASVRSERVTDRVWKLSQSAWRRCLKDQKPWRYAADATAGSFALGAVSTPLEPETMRIFKIRWWIPIGLAALSAAIFVALRYVDRQRTIEMEPSTGLGAVAREPLSFDPRSMWNQRKFSASQQAPHAAPKAVYGVIGGAPGGVSGGLMGGIAPDVRPYEQEGSATAHRSFVEAAAEPLSTFSIDVDTASYAKVRRYLSAGSLPPPDEVRVEELLNYFAYHYPDPKPGEPFAAHAELSVCPWNPRNRLLKIGLKATPIPTSRMRPAHLTFLIDVSGSMDAPDKLPLVKKAFALLVEQMRPQDSVAIVVYAGNAGLVLPPTAGSQKQAILDAMERLEAGGSTAGGAGIQLAYATARGMFRQEANNRVILATDGDFNVGVSSQADLVKLIESEREDGVFLTVLGFGMGDHRDRKLESLADHGNGQYAYIDSALEARRVFVEQLGGTLETIAKDVKAQVRFNPGRVRSYRLIGYENRRLRTEDFRDDRKDAGDLGAGHSVTALYEIVPHDDAALSADAFQVQLRYKAPLRNQGVEMTLPGVAETATPSADFQFAAAVAEFGLLLSGWPHTGSASFESAAARAGAHTLGNPDRVELVRLIRVALPLPK